MAHSYVLCYRCTYDSYNLHQQLGIVEDDYYRPSVVTLIQNGVDFVVNVSRSVSTIVWPLSENHY